MSVPVLEGPDLDEPALLDLAERFHDQHEAERGFAFRNQQPLLRGVRLVTRGRTPKPARLAEVGTLAVADDAQTATRQAYFGEGFVATPVYDGTRLGAGVEVRGPALVEEPFTVVVVPPDGRVRVDETGNYELEL
jgi:N-methylhydantoinase A